MLSIFIIIVFLIIVSFVLRFEHTVNKVKLIAILSVLFLLIASVAMWIGNGNADFSSTKTMLTSVFGYFSWAKSTGLVVFNTGKDAVYNIGDFMNNNKTKSNILDGRR